MTGRHSPAGHTWSVRSTSEMPGTPSAASACASPAPDDPVYRSNAQAWRSSRCSATHSYTGATSPGGPGLSRKTTTRTPVLAKALHRWWRPATIAARLSPAETSCGSLSARPRTCDVITMSGGSARSRACTASIHAAQSLYGRPLSRITASVNAHPDFVNVTTRQLRASATRSIAEIHCRALESPTSAIVTSPARSP